MVAVKLHHVINIGYDNYSKKLIFIIKSIINHQTNYSKMATDKISKIKGLHVCYDAITEEQEKELLDSVNDLNENETVYTQPFAYANLKVFEFGWNYNNNRNISEFSGECKYLTKTDKLTSIPTNLVGVYDNLRKNILKSYSPETVIHEVPDHCMINQYDVGGGILQHFDHRGYWGENVVGISLGSGATMKFNNTTNTDIIEFYLPARTSYFFEQDARTIWQHGIVSAAEDTVDEKVIKRKKRVAITYRMLSDRVMTSSLRHAAGVQSMPWVERRRASTVNVASTVECRTVNPPKMV
jgi:alkylated DNA repair dioxygenase AlkB